MNITPKALMYQFLRNKFAKDQAHNLKWKQSLNTLEDYLDMEDLKIIKRYNTLGTFMELQ